MKITVRRYDGSYRVTATDWQLEYTHLHRFPTQERAARFARRIRESLEFGGDLNLAHWEYTGP